MLGLTRLLQFGTGKYGAILLALFLVLQGYLIIRPSTSPLDPARAEAADRVAADVGEALGAYANSAWSGKYVKVERLQGDQGDHLRTRIESALQSGTNCRLVTDSMLAGLRDQVAAKAARLGIVKAAAADAWKGRPVATTGAALGVAREAGLDYVVYGVVEDFRTLNGIASLRAAIEVAGKGSAVPVFRRTFKNQSGMVFAHVDIGRQPGKRGGASLRLSGWLLFVVLLPICTAPFWREQLERESNFVNFTCLGALTSVDALVTWSLMGFRLGTVWLGVVFTLAVVLAWSYNLLVLSTLERNREREAYAA